MFVRAGLDTCTVRNHIHACSPSLDLDLIRRKRDAVRVAERLNAEGYRPINGADQFHGDLVGRILRQRSPDRDLRALGAREVLQKAAGLVVDLSTKLGMPKNTLHAWMQRGWIHYRHLEGYRAPCLCWADGPPGGR